MPTRRPRAPAVADPRRHRDASSRASPTSCDLAVTVLLAEGHLLIEDVPGRRQDDARQGAGALASTARCAGSSSRPTCCPATSPASASTTRRAATSSSSPGAVFANIVVGDEINRASPKTQSALLECMEERQVTVDGTTYQLQPPFMVIATQNPIEMEGTYPLPEAQRDRFMARRLDGLPRRGRRDRDARLPRRRTTRWTTSSRSPTPTRSRQLIDDRRAASTSRRPSSGTPSTSSAATRAHARAAARRLAARRRCTWCGRPRRHAALHGRDYVLPDDVQRLALAGARPPAAAQRRGASSPGAPPTTSSRACSPTCRCRGPGRAPEGRRVRSDPRAPPRRPPPAGGGLAGLSALTTRGRSFLAAGVTAFVCALVLGQRDLLRVGVLLAVAAAGLRC